MNAKPNILIAEDDTDIRELLKTIFEMEEYAVITTGNGQEALDQLVAGENFDLILLDLNMPVLSGREFLKQKQVRALAPGVPVIVFAATRDREPLDGIADWIKKPVSLDELIRTVQIHLNQRGWNFCLTTRMSPKTKAPVSRA